MSRANDYLRSVLTAAEYLEYRRHAALDSRDSEARKRYRRIAHAQRQGASPLMNQRIALNHAWLLRYGYIDDAGAWISEVKR